MRDYNFFSSYIFTTKSVSIKRFVLPIFLILLIGAISITWFLLDSKINKKQELFDANEKVLNSRDYQQTMEKVEQLREELLTIRGITDETYVFSLLMQESYKVTDDLMYIILFSTPQNIVYRNYSINEKIISISAETTEYSYIAEFESNLRKLHIFDEVLVSRISLSEDIETGYSFDINLTFGGDDLD